MRRGSLISTEDPRLVAKKRLRKTEPLPLRNYSSDKEDLYYHEAQTSSLSWGPDEWLWTEICLVDTYFGSEERHKTYFHGCKEGDGLDPPSGGRFSMVAPVFDPRWYFLLKLRFRIDQATTEYSALVETFDKRMDEYAQESKNTFEEDNKRSNTECISNVIETAQIFIDSISGIVDAWETFKRNDILLFTKHAPNSQTWPEHIDAINRNITGLDRLRKLLFTKQERFKFKLESFHTISSLSQAHAAVTQGDDLRMLTKVTVYIAFPLLFTTAFFGMDFISPKYPWPIFVGMLLLTALVNYMIASQRSPKQVWKELKERRHGTRKQGTV